MTLCISVSFDFKGKEYYAIIGHREAGSRKFYQISSWITNWSYYLNKGNFHIIKEIGGRKFLTPN